MPLLTKASEIWQLEPSMEARRKGADYALVSLPWTFDRMSLGTTSENIKRRVLNIAKGVVAQLTLHEALLARGVKSELERKSYREDDVFDLRITNGRTVTNIDFKTLAHYTDYPNDVREPFQPKLIVENARYRGPDWRKFFPMLVPMNQINQGKDIYCFGITSSIDIRKDVLTDRPEDRICAFPHGPPVKFFSYKTLVTERERAEAGFYVRCSYSTGNLLNGNVIEATIFGEWNARTKKAGIELTRDGKPVVVGPFSAISAIQIDRDMYRRLYGVIELVVEQNDFTAPVRDSQGRNLNKVPDEVIEIRQQNFTNLMLPSTYPVHVIGWTTRGDFIDACKTYSAWVWPRDSVSRYENQAWGPVSEDDARRLRRVGFEDRISKTKPYLRAGLMKTSGRGQGACCYIYPNTFGSGLRDTNMYALPADLHTMDELVNNAR